jgi:DNA-binding MarR family transcriptional regulator
VEKRLSPQKEALHKFLCANRLHRKTVESLVGKLGWQHTQHRILIYLHLNSHNNPSQRDISEFLQVTPAAVTVTLKKMEKAGLIERSVSNEDNRVHQISISPYGQRIVRATNLVFDLMDQAVFKGFEQEDLKIFIAYLDRIQANINELDIEKIVSEGRKALKTV